jgi:hypothetical protein
MAKEKRPFDPNLGSYKVILQDLPLSIYRGIGRIVSAHAVLEAQVFELFCELSRIDSNIGRVAIQYRSASERFKTVRRLLVMHDIKTTENLKPLFADIEQCCRLRDSFAHGLWTRDGENTICLRLTKGEYESEDGLTDRSFMPQLSTYSQQFFIDNREKILEVADRIGVLRDEVEAALKLREQSSPQTPEPEPTQGHNQEPPRPPPQSSEE